MAFDAGSIESRLTLDRSPFTAGLKAARKEANEFANQRFTATARVNVQRTQFDILKRQLAQFNGKTFTAHMKVEADRALSTIPKLVSGLTNVSRTSRAASSGIGALSVGSRGMAASFRLSAASGGALAVVLAASLAPAIGLVSSALLAIPAAASVAVGGLAAVALGMKGIKSAAKTLQQPFQQLKQSVSEVFKQGLIPVMKTLKPLFDPLTKGFKAIADSLVGIASTFAKVLTQSQTLKTIATIGQQIANVFTQLQGAIKPAVQAFLTLTTVGLSSIKPFINAIVQFAKGFQQVISQLQKSGTLSAALKGLGQVVGAILPVLNTFFEVGARMMAQLAGPLAKIIQALGKSFKILAPVLTQLSKVFINALAPVLPIISRAFAAIIKAITPFLPIIGKIIQALLPPLITAFQIVAKILKAFLLPVLHTLMPPLRKISMHLMNALLKTFRALKPAIPPLVHAIVSLVKAIVPILPLGVKLISTILPPLAKLIAKLVPPIAQVVKWLSKKLGWVIRNVTIPLFNFFMMIIRNFLIPVIGFLGDTILWLWNHIFKPVFNFIGDLIQWLWNTILKPIFHFIGWLWDKTVRSVQWAWNHILQPVWKAVADAANWLWNNILKPVFGFIGDAWDNLADGLRKAWKNIIEPVINSVGDAFQSLKGFAIDAWNGVLSFFGKGVNAVIKGIQWVIGKLEKIPGVPDIPEPGLWNWRSLKLGGSGIAVGAAVHAAGTNRIGGGFATNQPRAIVGEGNTTRPEFVIPTDPRYRSRALALYEQLGGQLMQGGGALFSRLGNIVTSMFPTASISSGFRPNSTTFHGPGYPGVAAVDIVGPHLLRYFRGIASQLGAATNELFYSAANFQINAGQRLPYPFPNHYDHVHWAAVGRLLNAAGAGGGGFWSTIGNAFSSAWDFLGGDTLVQWISGVFGSLKDMILSRLPSNFGFFGDALWGLVKKAWEGIKNFIFDDGGYLPPGYSVAFNGTGHSEPVGPTATANDANLAGLLRENNAKLGKLLEITEAREPFRDFNVYSMDQTSTVLEDVMFELRTHARGI